MSARVCDLLPGDLVTLGSMRGTFISSAPHPAHHGLQLVVWRLPDGTWSLDALLAVQEVGEAASSTAAERWERVQAAFAR